MLYRFLKVTLQCLNLTPSGQFIMHIEHNIPQSNIKTSKKENEVSDE